MKLRLSSAGLFLLSVLIALLVVEICLRVFSPVELRLQGREIRLPHFREYRITAEPGSRLPEMAVHTRNGLGFRGPPPPNDFERHLTLIAVGGSTTECFALGDGLCWPARLQERLSGTFSDVWVNNAGLAGHTSQGHIELLRQHIVDIRPDAVLFLVGVNDLYFSEFTEAYDRRLNEEEDTAEALRHWAAENSALVSLTFAAYKQWRAQQHDLTGQDRDFTELLTGPTPPEDAQAELARHRDNAYFGYRDRLEDLVAISRSAGIIPIFATQPAVYGPATDPRTGIDLGAIRNGVDGFDGRTSWRLLEAYNDVMRDVAHRHEVLLMDLADKMPKDSTFFLDQVHFTPDGADRVADILYPGVCALLAEQFPSHVTGAC